MLGDIFKPVVDLYMANVNYFSITVLMAVESSFIPFPSEIVIPPAAYKAAAGELNIVLVILFGTIGAMIGAVFNYFMALFLGRKLIYKFADTKIAHFLMLNKESVEKSEAYFRKYGKISTFIGRLVPAIRQLISIPAGLSKMNIKDFLLFTALGAAIWNILLALLGYFLYSQKELLDKYYNELTWIGIILGAVLVVFIVVKTIYSNRKKG